MSIINSLIISSSIAWADHRLPYIIDPIEPNYQQIATRTVAKALYREYNIGKYVKQAERKYIPKPVRKYGGYAGIIVQVSVQQRVSWEWTF